MLYLIKKPGKQLKLTSQMTTREPIVRVLIWFVDESINRKRREERVWGACEFYESANDKILLQ